MTDMSSNLRHKIGQSFEIYQAGLEKHLDDRMLAATCVLFSGGNDSTVLAHLFRNTAEYAIHANTTIGIEETRQFVRDRCADWGLTLLEKTAPVSFRDLVIEQGFPGPAMHFKMYQRLKERCLREARNEIIENPRRERVVFLAGRRRAESSRRANVPENERDGSVIWISPLVHWDDADMAEYRAYYDLPRNTVSERIGMSGECLCGAFADVGEYHRLAEHFPEVAAEISEIQDAVREAGHPPAKCRWGWGAYRDDPDAQGDQDVRTGPLCSSCDFRRDPEVRVNDLFRSEPVPAELTGGA